jgi:GNAT superfamily N-acetyltransferase
LTDAELRQLTEVDHVKRDAVIAMDLSAHQIVGVARYAASPERDDVAEVAVEVVDHRQGRGLGRALVAEIIDRARAHGIARLTASSFSTNRRALALLRHFGFRVLGRDHGVTAMELTLGS